MILTFILILFVACLTLWKFNELNRKIRKLEKIVQEGHDIDDAIDNVAIDTVKILGEAVGENTERIKEIVDQIGRILTVVEGLVKSNKKRRK